MRHLEKKCVNFPINLAKSLSQTVVPIVEEAYNYDSDQNLSKHPKKYKHIIVNVI
jgi:hypothetical protein